MKAAGADAHDIKQQQNVLGETLMMIPDCTTRLRGTLEHTEDTIVRTRLAAAASGPCWSAGARARRQRRRALRSHDG